jgi:hypothetical protein
MIKLTQLINESEEKRPLSNEVKKTLHGNCFYLQQIPRING